MTDPGRADAERRVLILAPSGRDAALARDVFARAGIASHVCADFACACDELDAGAAALLVAEEAAGTDRADRLTEWLARQPPWSDLPVLLLARPGADSAAVARAVELLGNVTVLERPARISTLVSAARTALRSRDRQYQARQHLLDREQVTAELRTLMDLLPVGVFIAHDPACRRITGNRAGSTILRMPVSSNLSKSAPDGERPTHFRPSRGGVEIPPDQLPVQRAARGEVVVNEEIDQVFDDGTVVHTLISASPLLDAGGGSRGAVASITDITERKRAEAAVRASEARFRTFADTAPAMLWVTEPDGACSFLSRGWYEFTGQAEGAGLGFGWLDAVHPADRPAAGAAFLSANARRASFALEHRLRRADGEYRWVMDAGRPRAGPAGEPLGYIGSVIDIDDRKRAEDESARLAGELRLVTDAVPALVSYVGTDFTYRFVNRAYEEWFGLARGDILGRHMREVLGEAAFEKVRPHVAAALAGRRVHVEMELPYRLGGTRYVLIEYVPDDRPGGAAGYYSLITDITDRKQAEEQLRRNHDTFFTLIENAPFGVYVVDAGFRLRVVSAGARAVFANVRPLLGRDFAEALRVIWPEPFAREAIGRFRHTLTTGEPYAAPDTTERRGDVAAVESYDWKIERITLPDGMFGVVCYFYDITARKEAEAALRAAAGRQTYLVRLADALRPLSDPDAVPAAAARVLAAHLATDRVAYFQVVGGEYVVDRDHADGLPSLAGRYPVAAFGAELVAAFSAGRTVAEVDATAEPGRPAAERAAFAAIGVRGHVDVPLVKAGALVAGMTVHCRTAREWTADEVALVEETAERTWAAVERARAERARQASDERYRTLFDTIDEGFCVIEFLDGPHGPLSDYVHVEANPAYERHAGIPDVVGQRVRDMVPDEADAWVDRYRGVLLTGEPIRFERELVATGRHLELSAFRVEPAARRQVAVLFQDVSARKRAEAALGQAVADLSEAHRFLNATLDALTSHIAVLDEAGTILAVNAAWRQFADDNQFNGLSYGVGANYLAASDPGGCGDGSEVAAGLRAVLDGRQAYFQFEYPCHSPTEHRWFTLRVSRFTTPGPVRVVVSHEDVTTRREAEEALKDADRRKNEFLAMLAHELRNPLAPIRNALHILRLLGGGGPEAAGVHDMMDRQVANMVRLVDDLLEVSRITRGKIDLRRAPIELAAVLRTAVETSRPLIDAASHALTVDVPADGLVVHGDAVRLAQVFANLLNNAAKYTEPGGAIHLVARREGGEAVAAVRDTGAGIPAEMLARVFDLFTQIDRSDARAQGGLGIGLTLVKSLVELHGGRVAVRSDGPGTGSEFEVRLPLASGI